MNCKMCNDENLFFFLDLGEIPLVDRFLTEDELLLPESFYPLQVHICDNCGLVQLGYIVPQNELFNENYAYESSTTLSRHENYDELAKFSFNHFNLKKNDLVVDIGSNIGVLLECFKNLNLRVLGVDASSNIVQKALDRGINTILGFFDQNIATRIINEEGKASIITATNLFAHIQNYESFIKSLKILLDDDGVFIFQVPHFLQLLKNNEYDTIYHEHICYFGLKPLMKFFEKYEMEIFDVQKSDIDGGSIRCFVSKKGNHKLSQNIFSIINEEQNEKIYSHERLLEFAEDVKNQKNDLVFLLSKLKREGKSIVGVGAPAKGMTLLNYCKIGHDFLDYVTEKAPLKIGKFTPGTHIFVKDDSVLIKEKPDFALILAWNFKDEIMKNLQEYSSNGGQFIIPIPNPQII
jgi:SAM-dependent methyltransferase